jgi:tape measure domain-containing protein
MKVGEVFVRMAMDYSQYDKDERTAKARVTTLGSSLSGILKNAFSFGLGMGFFAAVQRGFRSTIGSALDYNATMQQAAIGFETMLGSAQRAQAFVDQMADFAAKTPFEFQGLLDASKRMMALGFASHEVLPTLSAIGDAAAALGTGQEGINTMITALGQMRTAGKINSRQMMQLSQAGVPAWDMLAKAIGRSTAETRELVEKGLVSADQGIAAFVTGVNQRFPGMMGKMEDSWAGVTSTIRDVWRMTLGDMTSGLFRRANDWLKRVRDTASGFYDAYKQGGLRYAIEQTFGVEAAAAVNTVSTVLQGVWSVVAWVAGGVVTTGRWIVSQWSTIGPIVRIAVAGFLALKTVTLVLAGATTATTLLRSATLALNGQLTITNGILAFVSQVVGIYRLQLHLASAAGIAHVGVLQMVKTAVYSLQAALGVLLWPLMIIGILLGIGMSLWNKYSASVQQAAQKAQMERMAAQQKAYLESVNAATKGTESQTDAMEDMNKAASQNLQSFDEVHSLMDEMASANAPAFALGDAPGMPEMPDLTMDMSGLFGDLAGETEGARATLGGFWDWVKDGAGKAWDSLKTTAAEKWTNFTTWVGEKWTNFKTWAGTTWHGITTAAAEKWDELTGWVAPKWEAFKTWVGDKWNTFRTWASERWDGIKDTIAGKWDAMKTAVAEKWGTFTAWVGERWDVFKTWAADQWKGIKGAIVEQWDALKAAVGPVWEGFRTWVGEKWSAFRTWAGERWDGIKDTIAGKWDAMKTAISDRWSGIKSAIADRWADLRSTVSGWIASAVEWGRNLVSNIAAGIRSGQSSVQSAVSGIAETVAGYMAYESPAEKGPGRYADRWAPNLMRMYTDGILANVGRVQAAARDVAQGLMPMTAAPDFALAGVSGGGNRGSMPVVSAPSWPGGGPAPEIHLHIGTFIGDSQGLRQLERKLREIRYAEDQRTGVSGS